VIVGIEEGLFAKAGLDVRFSATYADREKDSADRPIMSRLKEQLFDCGSADSQHRPAGARQARRQHRGVACRGGRAGDPDLRGRPAGAARHG
jgi:hypothetical protein